MLQSISTVSFSSSFYTYLKNLHVAAMLLATDFTVGNMQRTALDQDAIAVVHKLFLIQKI